MRDTGYEIYSSDLGTRIPYRYFTFSKPGNALSDQPLSRTSRNPTWFVPESGSPLPRPPAMYRAQY
jgi:hypothetical protein